MVSKIRINAAAHRIEFNNVCLRAGDRACQHRAVARPISHNLVDFGIHRVDHIGFVAVAKRRKSFRIANWFNLPGIDIILNKQFRRFVCPFQSYQKSRIAGDSVERVAGVVERGGVVAQILGAEVGSRHSDKFVHEVRERSAQILTCVHTRSPENGLKSFFNLNGCYRNRPPHLSRRRRSHAIANNVHLKFFWYYFS